LRLKVAQNCIGNARGRGFALALSASARELCSSISLRATTGSSRRRRTLSPRHQAHRRQRNVVTRHGDHHGTGAYEVLAMSRRNPRLAPVTKAVVPQVLHLT
jgi:hypothetical protein